MVPGVPESAPAPACPLSFLGNWRGGFTGILIYLAASILFFFIAFMAAFGNDTPGSRLILQGFGLFIALAHPLWMLPLSYAAGARWIWIRSGIPRG